MSKFQEVITYCNELLLLVVVVLLRYRLAAWAKQPEIGSPL